MVKKKPKIYDDAPEEEEVFLCQPCDDEDPMDDEHKKWLILPIGQEDHFCIKCCRCGGIIHCKIDFNQKPHYQA